MNKKIAVLSGDGIGPEVVAQAIKVLDAIAKKFNHTFEYSEALAGAIAIDKTGNPMPDETLKICLDSDAILFGAIGDPKYDNDPNAKVRPEQGLLKIRKEMGLFCNIRPVTTYDSLISKSPLKEDRIKGADLVVYRELTGGIYFGDKGRKGDGSIAYDNCEYSVEEIERIAKLAFEAAQARRKKLTLVDKANVLETSRLWRDVVKKMAPQYADVEVDFLFVDNAAMQMIVYPTQFDVILTENMFGDIISDEASVITGSLGLLASASIGAQTAMFEPCHGSYPQAAGKNIANPAATILSAAMMLDYFKLFEEANLIREAVQYSIDKGLSTVDVNPENPQSTSSVGNIISAYISEATVTA
ncbi:3-isopropylmalate dehydrogenase [Solitalea lacus]|uniref:3-isopropylmalate dehydrogenase n=1 Tax=Solitalea lacus TaxID=2911172 RepID=UPI001EDC67C9|nr:3-isopropylmalate dehydrogenase [Solitalea lacus]UKJ08068.1 3-isopropylmalate dehydrogenase [Solitalea lacus]